MVVKLYHPYTQFPRNLCLSNRRIVTFLLLRLRTKYSYLLTYLLMSYLLINIYGSSMENTCELKFLSAGLECYEDTHMKSKLTTLQKKLLN